MVVGSTVTVAVETEGTEFEEEEVDFRLVDVNEAEVDVVEGIVEEDGEEEVEGVDEVTMMDEDAGGREVIWVCPFTKMAKKREKFRNI